MNIKKLAIYAMLSAMCAVLGYVAVDLGTVKITFESLPVLLAGFLYGPVAGMTVGAVGTFIYQVLKYGIMVTTVLWILPYVICGLIAGIGANAARKVNGNGDIKIRQSVVIVVVAQLMITVLNTGVQILDGIILSYPTEYALLNIPIRLVMCIAKSIAFGILIPYLVKAIRKAA